MHKENLGSIVFAPEMRKLIENLTMHYKFHRSISAISSQSSYIVREEWIGKESVEQSSILTIYICFCLGHSNLNRSCTDSKDTLCLPQFPPKEPKVLQKKGSRQRLSTFQKNDITQSINFQTNIYIYLWKISYWYNQYQTEAISCNFSSRTGYTEWHRRQYGFSQGE